MESGNLRTRVWVCVPFTLSLVLLVGCVLLISVMRSLTPGGNNEAEVVRQSEIEATFGPQNFSMFPYDLGGTLCACPNHYYVKRAWAAFADNNDAYVMPHVQAVIAFYMFTQSSLLVLVLTYLNESLEEFLLMATGKWGFNFGSNFSHIETRYDSILRDTILVCLVGLPVGILLVRKTGVPPLAAYKWPPHWNWDLGDPSSVARYALLFVEYMAVTQINLIYSTPTKHLDLSNISNVSLIALTPLVTLCMCGINFIAGVYTDRSWLTLHISWAVVQAIVWLVAYLSPLDEVLLLPIVFPLIVITAFFLPPVIGYREKISAYTEVDSF